MFQSKLAPIRFDSNLHFITFNLNLSTYRSVFSQKRVTWKIVLSYATQVRKAMLSWFLTYTIEIMPKEKHVIINPSLKTDTVSQNEDIYLLSLLYNNVHCNNLIFTSPNNYNSISQFSCWSAYSVN